MLFKKGHEWPYFRKKAVTKAGRKIREEKSPDNPSEYRSEFRLIIAGYVRLGI